MVTLKMLLPGLPVRHPLTHITTDIHFRLSQRQRDFLCRRLVSGHGLQFMPSAVTTPGAKAALFATTSLVTAMARSSGSEDYSSSHTVYTLEAVFRPLLAVSDLLLPVDMPKSHVGLNEATLLPLIGKYAPVYAYTR